MLGLQSETGFISTLDEVADALEMMLLEVGSILKSFETDRLSGITDIHQRLQAFQEIGYALQQLRYLQHMVEAGHAKPKASAAPVQ